VQVQVTSCLQVQEEHGVRVKKLHEPVAGLIACAFLEKLCRGFHYSNLFRHCRSDPLVQGDSVLLCQTLRRLLDREGEAAFLIERGSFKG
jgi:hypothetical protein